MRGYEMKNLSYEEVIKECKERAERNILLSASCNDPVMHTTLQEALDTLKDCPHLTVYQAGNTYYTVGITTYAHMCTAHTLAQETLYKVLLDSGMTKTSAKEFVKQWNQRNKEAGATKPWMYERE